MVACFYCKTDRVATVSLEHRSILSGIAQFVCLKSSEKFEKRAREDESLYNMACELLYIDSNQRLIDRPKRRIDGSSAVQP